MNTASQLPTQEVANQTSLYVILILLTLIIGVVILLRSKSRQKSKPTVAVQQSATVTQTVLAKLPSLSFVKIIFLQGVAIIGTYAFFYVLYLGIVPEKGYPLLAQMGIFVTVSIIAYAMSELAKTFDPKILLLIAKAFLSMVVLGTVLYVLFGAGSADKASGILSNLVQQSPPPLPVHWTKLVDGGKYTAKEDSWLLFSKPADAHCLANDHEGLEIIDEPNGYDYKVRSWKGDRDFVIYVLEIGDPDPFHKDPPCGK